MKRKTKRKKEKFFRGLSDISTKVFTIGGVIIFGLGVLILTASDVPLKPHLMIIIYSGVGIIVALILISVGLAYLHLKIHPSKIKYFEEVNFGEADNNTILKAVDGLLNFQKAEPFFVHVSPEFKEVSTILTKLEEAGLVIISGKPGEGKSMAAYQAAYKLSQQLYRIYSLKTTELEDKTWDRIHDRLFDELDWGLKGRKKIILVDDAHKLRSRKDLKRDLQKEAEGNNERYIWIETEEEYEVVPPNECIRIEFKEFVPNLLENFYEKPSLQGVFVDRINGLGDAKVRTNKGEINDAWHFAFCAAQGWERLVSKIKRLNEVELIVLFFISAHTVLSGGSALHEKEVLEKIRGIGFGWLSEQKPQMSIPEAIQRLYKPKKLIKLYGVNHDIGYIRSLHYKFAREIIKASLLSRQSYAKDMLTSVKALLTDKHFLCVYYGIFHLDIRAYAAEFDSDNKEWLINFINNLLPEWLKCYPPLLRGIKNEAKDLYDEIISNLDIIRIAEKVSVAEAGQIQQIANLLGAVRDRRDELIEKLDLVQLSKTASSADIGHFQQIASLLGAVRDRRDKLIEKLDLVQLSKTASSADIGHFQQIASLLGAVRDRRDELIEKLDLVQLSKTASGADVGQFDQLVYLLDVVGDRQDELIEKLDLTQLSKTASSADVGHFQQIASWNGSVHRVP